MSDKTKPPGQSAEPEASTRDRILAAATTEFARLGKAGARVDAIAHRAEVNKAMIYYHFQSKDNLYGEVIKQYFRFVRDKLVRSVRESASAEELLTAVAATYTGLFTVVEEFRPIMLRELADPDSDLLDQLAAIIRDAHLPQQLMELLSDNMAAGTYRELDLRQTLLSFITMNIGYPLIAPLANKALEIADAGEFMAQRKNAVVDLFLNGLKAR